MHATAWQVLATLAGVLITGGCTVWVARQNRRVTREDTLLNRYGERLIALEDREQTQQERLDALETKLTRSYAYIQTLKHHIYTGKQPPPPDWPDGLP